MFTRLLFTICRFLFTLLLAIAASACSDREKAAPAYNWSLPEGFPLPQIPANNPMSKDKVRLGRALFYDENLSANQKQACSSCHLQENGFAEPRDTSLGSTGQAHRRNANALVNIAYNKTLTWANDGLDSLELQILLPMFGEDPVELGITGHEDKVLARFKTDEYQALFSKAFPNQSISYPLIVKALASFVRSLISLQSPFDRYAYYAEDDAISAAAIRGMNLFFSERLECHHCHGGFNFTQSTFHQQQLIDRRPFHNTGLYNIAGKGYPTHDVGLAEITLSLKDNGRFRAPSLRNVALSGPYMHDGSIATLAEVIAFYMQGGRDITSGSLKGDGRQNKLKSPFIKGFELTIQEQQDLIAFLHTLTDITFITDPSLAAPKDVSHAKN